jgi:hypothetical protein
MILKYADLSRAGAKILQVSENCRLKLPVNKLSCTSKCENRSLLYQWGHYNTNVFCVHTEGVKSLNWTDLSI